MREWRQVGRRTYLRDLKRDLKLRIPKNAGLTHFVLGPVGRVLVAGFAVLVILSMSVFGGFYVKYSRLIDEKLKVGPFAATAKIYAAPESVAVGDTRTANSIGEALRRSGYTESRSNPIGSFQIRANSIEIYPGTESYFDQEPGVIRFVGSRISQIISLADNTWRGQYQLEPQLITNLSGPAREKRRFVTFPGIPKILVEAVTSAEDKRFFQHNGLDPVRIVKAAYVDLREGRKEQGASTLSQQLAHMFFLGAEKGKTWTPQTGGGGDHPADRAEAYPRSRSSRTTPTRSTWGSRGTFRIHGFGEAAEAYLGKDLSQITVPEAAELAGMIQRPAVFRSLPPSGPRARAAQRGARADARERLHRRTATMPRPSNAPLTVAKRAAQSTEAPYFVDLVSDAAADQVSGRRFSVQRLPHLHHARPAPAALPRRKPSARACRSVDDQIRRQRRFKGQAVPEPQVALVAIDPHTGEVRALAGGRNYGTSQLNHVLAKRQPGSIFKPFVYAAALDTAVDGGPSVITASTMA